MAKSKNIAIWIILVVVLAAAAGVIVIAVQNSKREQQLNTVQSAAALYQTNSKTSGGTTMSAKNGMKPTGLGRPSMRANTQMQQRPGQRQQMMQRPPMKQQHPGGRYDVSMVNAQAQLANRLPSQIPETMYNNGNVSMTTFAPQPPTGHVMSTTPLNYPPRSGGGALFIPNQSPQAEMPAQQLFVSHSFPSTVESKLQDMSNFSVVNAYAQDSATGTTLSNFVASAYFQDPATMTPNTYADGLGLDAYMPDVSNATPEGLDPQTGLPVFSTASLKRSNALSSRGTNGFLRPVMDDTNGYKKTIGKRIQTCRYNDCDLDKRRNQFNAARLNSGGEDVVLFNQTDFMYLP